jgi:hypothetical protein
VRRIAPTTPPAQRPRGGAAPLGRWDPGAVDGGRYVGFRHVLLSISTWAASVRDEPLARAGDITLAAAEKAIAELGIETEKPDPLAA